MAELSDKLHDKLKGLYPEGRALEMDRRFEAEDTKEPPITEDKIDFWKRNKSSSDIRGFDTPEAREPTDRAIIKDIGGGGKGLYIADHNTNANYAADKFIDPKRYKLGKLIYEERKSIMDFNTMKQAIVRAWSRDGQVRDLVNYNMKQEDWLSLWRHPIMQRYVEENTHPILIRFIMQRYRVEPVKASRVANKLSVTQRNKLVRSILSGKASTKAHKQKITSRTWTAEELSFFRANKSQPKDKIVSNYRGVFDSERSDDTIQRKFQSLPEQ
jgi:hypothetical protein